MKLLLFYFLPIITTLIFLSCSSESFVNLNSLKQEIKLKDFPDADAVVLSEVHDEHIIFTGDYKLEIIVKFHKVMKILRI